MANHNLKITLTNTRTQLPIYNCKCYIKVNSWYNSATGPIEPDIDSETSAHIFVNGKDYTTWSVGYYRYPKNITLVKVTSLDYNVTFDAQTVEISYTTDSSGNTNGTASFSVSATSAIGGTPSWSVRVLDGYSNPIPEASVSFPLKSSSGSIGISGIIVKTDDKGIATYTGESDTANTSSNISISKDGYKDKTTTWPDENGTITVILESTAIHVFGHIYDYVTRKGRSDVTVKYITRKAQIGTATVVQTTKTNSDGYYSFIISSTPGIYNFIEIPSSNVTYTLIGSNSIPIGNMTSGGAYERDFLVQSILVGDPYTGYSSPNSREDNWTPFKEFLVVKYNQELLTEKDYDPWQTIPHKIARNYLTYTELGSVYKIVTTANINDTSEVVQCTVTNGDKKWTLNYTINGTSGSITPGGTLKVIKGTYFSYSWSYNGTIATGTTEQIVANKTLIYENESYYEEATVTLQASGFSGNYGFLIWDGYNSSDADKSNARYLIGPGVGSSQTQLKEITPKGDLTFMALASSPGISYCVSTTNSTIDRITSKPTTCTYNGETFYSIVIPKKSLVNNTTYYIIPCTWASASNGVSFKMTNNSESYTWTCIPIVGRASYERGEITFTKNNEGKEQNLTYSNLYEFAQSNNATEISAMQLVVSKDSILDSAGRSDEDSRLVNVYINGVFDGSITMNKFQENTEQIYSFNNLIPISSIESQAFIVSIVIEQA